MSGAPKEPSKRTSKESTESGVPHSGAPEAMSQDETVIKEEVAETEILEILEEQELNDSDELALARAEANELRDRYLRLQAEWDNYRKRTTQERMAERNRAAARLIENLLPVIDDLERAIEHSSSADEASLKEGVQAVYNKCMDVFAREGVVAINPIGEAFDANVHSAIAAVEDATVEAETVVQVYQKGYEMGGRLLRPAMVIVSTK